MSRIYSVELPDDRRTYYPSKTKAMGMGQSQSSALEGTVVVREHSIREASLRALACDLLNGVGLLRAEEAVIGWFSKGRRQRVLED